MSELNAETGPVEGSADFSVLHKPGAVRLDDYPRLVYAPLQHGPGIRLEDNGTTVEDAVNAFAAKPDYEAAAADLGTTPDHVREAVRYAAACGLTVGARP